MGWIGGPRSTVKAGVLDEGRTMAGTDGVHDLAEFMRQVSVEMASEYERIRRRTHEDPGTAGDQGEENWASLLRDWLPRTYEV